MARNRSFWIIVSGVVPTAFRSTEREDLLPTLRQLQRKQPDTTMMWFDGGRFWTSPAAARAALAARERRRPDTPPALRDEWRPGGTHKDPKAKYKQTRDEKRARFKKRLIRGPETRSGDDQKPDGPASHSSTKSTAPARKPPSSSRSAPESAKRKPPSSAFTRSSSPFPKKSGAAPKSGPPEKRGSSRGASVAKKPRGGKR